MGSQVPQADLDDTLRLARLFELVEMWGIGWDEIAWMFEGGLVVWDGARYRLPDGVTLDEARKAARVIESMGPLTCLACGGMRGCHPGCAQARVELAVKRRPR